ncbi:hypothetical protein [Streptomyces yangpuensis]|uniref:hypothetical protein n=1 Tax=Streptomyces yangpuensis TaxID=1648182 RepID=UPI00364B915F
MEATVTTNADRAREGQDALEHYESGRAALGRTPADQDEVDLALASAARFGNRERDILITVEVLRADREEAVSVFLDLISGLFHAADGAAPPRLLIDTVLAEETMLPADVLYTWSRLSSVARRYAAFLAAIAKAAVASHDVYAQDLMEEARACFEDEAEEERYNRLNSLRAGA